MDEEVKIESNRGDRSTTFRVKTSEPFRLGGVFEKIREKGDILYKSRKRGVSLIERYDRGFYYNWKILKDANIPVIPTVRQTNRDTVVMTDLRADGSEIYGKSLMFQILDYAKGRTTEVREHHELDSRFLSIVQNPEEFDKVRLRAEEYARRATDAGIGLAHDDPFDLIIRPNGTWDLICLDVQNVVPRMKDASGHNEECVDNFMLILSNKQMQSYLDSKI